MKHFDILYKGRKIYTNLSYEDCSEVLQDLSEQYYESDDFDVNLIELEEINDG
jgi:hypothetical protein